MSHQANHIDYAIERAQQRLDSFFASLPGSKNHCRNPGGLREITLNLTHHLRGWGRMEPLEPPDSGAFLLECTEIARACDADQSNALLTIVHRLFEARGVLQTESDQGMQKAEQIDRHLGEDWQDLVVALLLALRAEEPLAASA